MERDPLKQAEEAKKLGPTIYELYEAWEKWAQEQGKVRETVRTLLPFSSQRQYLVGYAAYDGVLYGYTVYVSDVV